MLTATQATSIPGTKKYFENLVRGDYYLGQRVVAQWRGLAADRLGLGDLAEVTKAHFVALLEGNHPFTGKKLTQRNRSDRRPGVDLTFAPPKSVSLLWAITKDEAVLETFREAVHETMTRDVEPLMHRRVRQGEHAGTKQRTQTGNLIYAGFEHKTGRPVDGVVDPHVHMHCFIINTTEHDGRFYAGEFEEIIRQRKALQARFEARLASKLDALGYPVEKVRFFQSNKIKSGWEIAGIERSTIEGFSSRTVQIEDHARKHGITDAAEKGKLGKATRERKQDNIGLETLHQQWFDRLTDDEKAVFARLKQREQPSQQQAMTADEAIRFALDHHLYSQSTVERHQVVGTALEHGLKLLPEDADAALDRCDAIQRTKDVEGANRTFVTTADVLEAERRLIAFGRDGRGTRQALETGEIEFNRDWLNDQQKHAVKHVLTSRDTVTGVTGGAGTGKSALMAEAADAIAARGRKVYAFAPSNGAKEVLQENGFSDAQTVEHLLRNTQLQAQVKNQVLWIDEAGLLDVRSMNGIFTVAKQQNCRIVLSGDTRQHASVRRGEALRLLEREAGLNMARIETIQRQQGRYRDAVAMISRGNEVIDQTTGMTGLLAGYDMLDRLGKIKEISGENRHEQLADHYLESAKQGRSTLIVAPTHSEGNAVTECVRQKLRDRGSLDTKETAVTQLRSLNLSDAEKSQASSYHGDNLIVQFHQNCKGGFVRGQRYHVVRSQDAAPELRPVAGGPSKPIPFDAPDRFEVYSEGSIRLSAGDKVRFTLGGTATDRKRRISNGRLDEIKRVDRSGNLVLASGMTIAADYGHLDFGYVVTSHSAQGHTRDVAIAAMGSESLPAINARQFYVTVSRGSRDVAIYVDDKARVRRAIATAGRQMSATELIQESVPVRQQVPQQQRVQRQQRVQHQQRTLRERIRRWWQQHGPQLRPTRRFRHSFRHGPSPGFSGS
ncbi:MAG: MobF family relaxase [Planctomycetaceae bacterium]